MLKFTEYMKEVVGLSSNLHYGTKYFLKEAFVKNLFRLLMNRLVLKCKLEKSLKKICRLILDLHLSFSSFSKMTFIRNLFLNAILKNYVFMCFVLTYKVDTRQCILILNSIKMDCFQSGHIS